ncbi:hypothetical protein ACF08O_01360 [Streptomyces paradoxus]|uniref:hypothetical protein n=1 Tax=Streptomyces paradoxus TaxID=66375 RepID=UPI0036FC4F43
MGEGSCRRRGDEALGAGQHAGDQQGEEDQRGDVGASRVGAQDGQRERRGRAGRRAEPLFLVGVQDFAGTKCQVAGGTLEGRLGPGVDDGGEFRVQGAAAAPGVGGVPGGRGGERGAFARSSLP